MLVRARAELIGAEVLAADGPLGKLDDLYFDDWLETGEALDTPLRVRRSRAQLSSAPGLGVLSLLPAREKG